MFRNHIFSEFVRKKKRHQRGVILIETAYILVMTLQRRHITIPKEQHRLCTRKQSHLPSAAYGPRRQARPVLLGTPANPDEILITIADYTRVSASVTFKRHETITNSLTSLQSLPRRVLSRTGCCCCCWLISTAVLGDTP